MLRIRTRRIYQNEMNGASVYWDEQQGQVEFIHNDFEVIIRERQRYRS